MNGVAVTYNGLNTIAFHEVGQYGISNAVFFVAPKLIKSNIMNNNNQSTLPGVVILPADLQNQINEFFNYNGSLQDIEDLSWDFLVSATHGIEPAGLDIDRLCRMLFLYRQIYLMIVLIHKYKNLNHTTI